MWVKPEGVKSLLQQARAAAQLAYCPYSKFHVGAALLVRGSPPPAGIAFTGCNVENASYGLTVCAERNAIFHAASAVGPGMKIAAIAVTCPDAGADLPAHYKMPCGACRQVIAEFADEDTAIVVDGVGVFTMAELLPKAFKI